MASNQPEFDIFLSYNWDHKAHVQKLYEKLARMNLRVWIDDKELEHTTLKAELANGIARSRVFMCCVTEMYSRSDNCVEEFFYAKRKNKPMITLMFERFDDKIAPVIEMAINTQRRYNILTTNSLFVQMFYYFSRLIDA